MVFEFNEFNKKQIRDFNLLGGKEFEICIKHFLDGNPFSGPSTYFYGKVIEMRSKKSLKKLKKENLFYEYLYATLTSWGMHRMGDENKNKTALNEFEEFKEATKRAINILEDLENKKLGNLNDHMLKKLKKAFNDPKTRINKRSNAIFVAKSKLFHFLLPKLVVPMDRSYTIKFFHTSLDSKGNNHTDRFLRILKKCKELVKNAEKIQKRYRKRGYFYGYVPKIIDNAIVGYVKKYPDRFKREEEK